MDKVLTWFILANLAFALIWCFYRLFLHKDTFFLGKRISLLLGSTFALTYPLMDMTAWFTNSKPVTNITQVLSFALPEVETQRAVTAYHLTDILVTVYLSVVLLLFLRLFWQIGRLLVMRRCRESRTVNEKEIICMPVGTAPFSFFGMIYLHPEEHSQSDLDEILQHESAHIQQFHSLDVLFSEFICAIFWLNPFVWLLKYDLRENLEFLADKDVVHSGFDVKSYQYHLLRLSYQQTPVHVGNKFNVSQLKNRIAMMNKKRTPKSRLGKYFLSLPLLVLLLITSYAYGVKQEVEPPLNNMKTIENREASIPKTPTQNNVILEKKADEQILKTEEKPREGVQQMPQFHGGEEGLLKWLDDNVHYPVSASENSVEGRVVVRFVVGRDGEISDVTIVRGLDPACDKEIVRAIKSMPTWTPGQDHGKPVPVYFTMPVSFKLRK